MRIAAYDLADRLTRRQFDELCVAMTTTVMAVREALTADISAAATAAITEQAAAWLKPLIARTSAVIHGLDISLRRDGIDPGLAGCRGRAARALSPVNDPRSYPDRPFLAVSAVIVRDGRVLIVRRARAPAKQIYTLPGGVVEAGETLPEAVRREIREETGLEIEPVALAGHREFILRDDDKRVSRHFVILSFASRWIAGEPVLNDELDEARWIDPSELTGLTTTEGLAEIIAAGIERLEAKSGLGVSYGLSFPRRREPSNRRPG